MKLAIILIFSVVLCGCDEARNRPAQQVEDNAICIKAGMKSYLNGFAEIRCSP